MSIRPSFIATRFAGIETYQFAHDPRVFSIHPTGNQFTAHIGFNQTFPKSRVECVATIMAEASFTL